MIEYFDWSRSSKTPDRLGVLFELLASYNFLASIAVLLHPITWKGGKRYSWTMSEVTLRFFQDFSSRMRLETEKYFEKRAGW